MHTRLQRIAMSSGSKSTPMLAASNTPRPSYTVGKSYPITDMFATSLPG